MGKAICVREEAKKYGAYCFIEVSIEVSNQRAPTEQEMLLAGVIRKLVSTELSHNKKIN